jgi:drug/metabolite transporter (DMT)-like permease
MGSRASTTVYAQLALGMAVFGSATPVSKIVTSAMPVFVGSALRVGLGAIVLAPFVAARWDQVRQLERRDWLLVGLISLFGMFGFSALMLYGMGMISGVVGAVVMSTAPAVTAAGSMLLMGDEPTWRKLVAIALAVTGVLILQLGQGGSDAEGGSLLLGAALVFGAVCCEAAYTLLGKKVTERVDPLVVAGLSAALAVPIFLPLAIWQWGSFDVGETGWRAWSAVAWYGAGTLALGSWLWYSGLAKAEGSVAAAFMGVMPASALILSYVLLGEDFRWIHLAGFATVFAGVLLISWEHARMSGKG